MNSGLNDSVPTKSLGHTRENPRWHLVRAHPAIRGMVLSDRTQPLLANPPVWKGRKMLKLVAVAEKYLVATKCDLCGQHKESVRSRRTITIGLKWGTVRWQFCDECAATVKKWYHSKDEGRH